MIQSRLDSNTGGVFCDGNPIAVIKFKVKMMARMSHILRSKDDYCSSFPSRFLLPVKKDGKKVGSKQVFETSFEGAPVNGEGKIRVASLHLPSY